jgi:dTDP-L-rhamnose 4-epimerase
VHVKVLVTGGAGFVGSHLVGDLVACGHEVVVLDSLDPQVHGHVGVPRLLADHMARGDVRFLRGDVTAPEAVRSAFEGVDAVAHLAAAVGVGQSMYQLHHYVDTNGVGTARVLEQVLAARGRVGKLVVASSMSLYGEGAYRCPGCGSGNGRPRTEERLAAGRWEVACSDCGADLVPLPTPETKAPAIASVYAATKKHQEDLFVSFGRAYGLVTFALRFFNVYGPGQSLENPYTGVAAIFLSRLLNGRPPLVFEDGRQTRDFVEVADVARAVRLALEYEGDGQHVLNVASGRAVTVSEVAEALAAELGLELPPERLGRYRAGDVRHCIGDPSAARRVLGFEASRSFRQGLPRLLEWCRGQRPRDGVEAGLAELEKRGLVR